MFDLNMKIFASLKRFFQDLLSCHKPTKKSYIVTNFPRSEQEILKPRPYRIIKILVLLSMVYLDVENILER